MSTVPKKTQDQLEQAFAAIEKMGCRDGLQITRLDPKLYRQKYVKMIVKKAPERKAPWE